MPKLLTTTLLFLLGSFPSLANELVIRYLPVENHLDAVHAYYIDVLKLALDKTVPDEGPYRLQPLNHDMVQTRALEELKRNRRIDIYWTMTSTQREKELIPVRIPLLKGLLGYRIFIIRREDKQKFQAITSLDELRQYQAGQGHDWPDTKVLLENNINVTPVTDFDGLFTMLQKKRIDYIPRGINEPWLELEVYKDLDLMVDSHIMFEYRAPVYFFVNKTNQVLADRIEGGLIKALNDGSFEKLFKSKQGTDDILEKANFGGRLIFKLDNPFLTPETPLQKKSFWIK